jgi:cytochrome b561
MTEQAAGGTYASPAKALHWLIVALLIAQFIFAWTMPEIHRTVPVSTLIDLHVWFGTLILFVAVVRLAVRLTHGEPEPEDGLPPWQRQSARLTHWLLYILLFVVPVSFFGLFDLPKLIATRAAGWGWTGDVHGLLANYLLLVLVGLHVAAALYHHFVRRDRVLQRMLPGA